jgi:hypothetical protein
MEEISKGVAIQRGLQSGSEESPLLEAVTRERLVKAQRAGNVLAYDVVICELRSLAVAL